MNTKNETARRNRNLTSTYNEYAFFADMFLQKGLPHYFKRMSEEYGRYLHISMNPYAVNSKGWER